MNFQRQFFKFVGRVHVYVYQRTGGRIGSHVQGEDILLLITVGRKSGNERITPLAYLRDGENYVVAGGAAGSTKHPDWYYNAVHSTYPVKIQVKNRTHDVSVIDTQGDQRDALEQRVLAHSKQFVAYKRQAKRVIPILILRPVQETKNPGKTGA